MMNDPECTCGESGAPHCPSHPRDTDPAQLTGIVDEKALLRWLELSEPRPDFDEWILPRIDVPDDPITLPDCPAAFRADEDS